MRTYPDTGRSRWIVQQRGSKNNVQEDRPHAHLVEKERSASGEWAETAVIFLTNKECPWRCLMCDLWKNTLDEEVRPGAIPRQIRFALERIKSSGSSPQILKLYNSGSFFDPSAIPPEDYPEIALLASGFQHLIVECHPALIGGEVLRFRDSLQPTLEVAMGLETAHPQALAALNKGIHLQQFREKCAFLKSNGISIRVFLLVQPPFIPPNEVVAWAKESVSFSLECGADVVTLIPTRSGNGAMEIMREMGEFNDPPIELLEHVFYHSVSQRRARIFADTWDLERFSKCAYCFKARKARLDQASLSQSAPCPQTCEHCRATF